MAIQTLRTTSVAPVAHQGPRSEDWRFVALGLPPSADHETIDRAYWALTRERHGAKPVDPVFARRLARIDAAYQSLQQPESDLWSRWQAAAEPQDPPHRWSFIDSLITMALALCLLFNVILALSTTGNPAAVRVTHYAQTAGVAVSHQLSAVSR